MDQKITETDTTVVPSQTVQTAKTTETVNIPVQPSTGYQKKKIIFRMHQIIWYVVGLIEVLLIFRIILKALGANPLSGFVNLIYALSDPLALPFTGIFGTTITKSSVFEWSIIVAGIVYLLIGYGLVKLMQLVKPANPIEVVQTVDNQ
jgi:hypothetical protein